MRRFQIPNAALLAGLAVLLSGCSGETPTAPGTTTTPGGGTGGSCTSLVSLTATTDNPFAGSGSIVRATVTKAGAPVADGGSVQFTTSLGYFGENGLNTVSKTTVGGVADVTLLSVNSGTAQVTAVYDCARAQKNIQFQGVPDVGPVITSYLPTNGSCLGGDTVTITGVRLGNGTNVRVFFGGIEGSVTVGGNTQIKVVTPARTLKNPSVPESVPVVVVVNSVSSSPAAILFTYACISDATRMSISSITPTAGSPAGGDLVQILGRNFGTTIATTQVTFCGKAAQIVGQQDQLITVSTPTKILANPAVSEACDVIVTRDLGLVTQQSATAPKPFTYSGTGGNAVCNTDPSFFIASIAPNSGVPDGGASVTITGSGFGSNPALLRVDFGGIPATILGAITNTTIVVSSPRRTLASPDVPETVDVTVTDLGSVNQRCSRLTNAFVYTRVVLTPQIFSTSPKTGPNDSSTRVTIFGDGFQFPMQVFMTGGACAAQRVEASSVNTILLNTIVFNTPVATNNVCLLNQLVDIVILNPSTGKTASIPAAFKYYSCPVSGTASPSAANGTVSTTVVISGANFEEPITANFSLGSSLVPLSVSSVSSNAIVLTMPPLNAIVGGAPKCGDVFGTINIAFLSLTCSPIAVPFTYRIDPPVATTASPNNLNQDGSAFPGPLGSPVAVTVVGSNFANPMTVQLIKDGAVVANTPVNNATVANATSLTFSAPAVLNSSLNQQNCLTGGSISGIKFVPTSFGIRLTSTSTGCTVDLPNVLVYNPIDPTCRTALTITTPSLPAGTFTGVPVAYGPVTMAAVGGTGIGYVWSAGGLPGGLTINAGGVISGTPTAAGTFTVTVTVTDSAANVGSRVYTLQVN
jgi:hypothetical protein